MGSEDQKRRFLGPFVNPDRPRWGSFAMTEPGAGSDVSAIETRCVKDGAHWVLNGEKSFAGNASRADWISCDAIPRSAAPGTAPSWSSATRRASATSRSRRRWDSRPTSRRRSRCDTAACRHRTCSAGGALRKARRLQAPCTVQRDAADDRDAVGIGRAALDEALAFAREADRLGDPRVRDRLERGRRKLRVARLLCWRAAWLADRRQPNMVEASLCKAIAPSAALEIASAGMEILGDVGGRGDTSSRNCSAT
jgi:acyl-CoA dehydrogenase